MHFFRQKVRHTQSFSLRNLNDGFTLIELMITVAIVGILAAVALPSYRDYVIRGNIPDAIANLAAKRVTLEQYFQDNKTYANPNNVTNPAVYPCLPDTQTGKYFNFSCTGTAPDANNYTLQADGKGSMTGFSYTVNQSGAKSTAITGVTGWTGNGTCWVTNKGGVC